MSFKHKRMQLRQARSAERTANQHRKPGAVAVVGGIIPEWSVLAKMGKDEVAALLAAHKMASTGQLMRDKSALHRAR